MNTDPVIAKIHKQRQLYQSWTAVIDDDDDKSTAACAAYNTAFKRLVRTKPRTRTGAVALVRYCLDDARFPVATATPWCCCAHWQRRCQTWRDRLSAFSVGQNAGDRAGGIQMMVLKVSYNQ